MFLEVDGQETFCGTGGRPFDATQPNIIFIHGAALDNTVWTLFARYYARRGYNVFAFDLPGHGHSAGEPLGSVEDIAQWVGRAMDALQIERASIVGHSLGALVALQMAARQAPRVERIVLLAVALPMGVAPPFLEAARSNSQAAIDMFVLFGFGYPSQLGSNPIAGINIFNSGLRLVERAGEGVMFADLNACNEFKPPPQLLANIGCPATIIQGREDAMTPVRSAHRIAGAMTDCETVEIPGCGHMSYSEKPEEVHRALKAALTR